MVVTQIRYKIDDDKTFCREPKIRVGDEVYIGSAKHAVFVSDSSNKFARRVYNKLMHRTCGLNKVSEVQLLTFYIS